MSDTALVPTCTPMRVRSIVRTRSGDRSSRGSSCAAAYGSSSAGRAPQLGRRSTVGRSRCETYVMKAS